MLDIPDRSTSSPTQLTSDMPCTPVPSGSSSALKLLVLSVVSSYAFGLAYEHAAAYYVELSRSNALLVWTKYPMPLIALVPGVVWSACRAVAFVALGVYVAYSLVLGSIAASYDRLTHAQLQEIVGPPEHARAGPSQVVDPMGVDAALRAGMPLLILDGREPERIREAIEGGEFGGTIVV